MAIRSLGLAMLGSLLLASSAAGGGGDWRPWRLLPRLVINTSMKQRNVARLSLAAGEAQMAELCQRPGPEELWAYLPGEKLFIELGCCEKVTAQGTYVGVDRYIYRLFARYRHLIIYHIQPRSHFVAQNYGPSQVLLRTIAEALPSEQDMAAMIQLSRKFWTLQPQGRLVWRIRSRFGVTEYGLTPQGKAHGGEIDLTPFAYLPLEEEDLVDSRALLNPSRASPALYRHISRACRLLSSRLLLVRFSPRR